MDENRVEWYNIFLDQSEFEKTNPINVFAWSTYFIIDQKNSILLKTTELDLVKDFFIKNL
jgi:hypothetical protein